MEISVIVPIYCVESCIERCVRSLFEQTLGNIEYIFVDDCSPDNSIDILNRILEEYPNRKPQVRIIRHKTNLGAAIARKNGILAATGEYIIHCDSDDWVDRDMYRAMYEKAKSEDLDMVVCKSMFYTNGITQDIVYYDIREHKFDFFSDVIAHKTQISLCGTLVRTSTFHNNLILYPNAHMYEDVALFTQITYYSNRIGVIEQPYYFYYQNPKSICNHKSEIQCIKKWQHSKDNVDLIMDFLRSKNEYDKYRASILHLKHQVRGFLYPLLKENMKYYNQWYNTYPELNIQYVLAKKEPLSLKILFIVVLLRMYPILNRIKR